MLIRSVEIALEEAEVDPVMDRPAVPVPLLLLVAFQRPTRLRQLRPRQLRARVAQTKPAQAKLHCSLEISNPPVTAMEVLLLKPASHPLLRESRSVLARTRLTFTVTPTTSSISAAARTPPMVSR